MIKLVSMGNWGTRRVWIDATMTTTALIGAMLAVPVCAQADQLTVGVARSFHVPAGSLSDALTVFGQQSGMQVSVVSSLIRGVRAAGASGTMTSDQALGHVLAGTGLTYGIAQNNLVTLQKVPTGTSASGAETLGQLDVEGGSASGYGPYVGSDRINDPRQVTANSKMGTKLGDLLASVQVVPREVLSKQGATMLRQSLTNASGVNFGGQDSKGFYDHFLIRGLNAQIYEDGFSDGDQLGGLSHSLNGVQRIEVLEGPGSALFGSGPPGGTINIVHYDPLPEFHAGASVQGGSFGTISNNDWITGPTGIQGLNYRVDATVSHADGFRSLESHDYEVRPALQWKGGNHTVNVAIDLRQIYETPDSYGIIYFNGSPLKNVSINSKYSTPFAYAHSNIVRPTISDKWEVNDFLTITNRFAYTYRTLDALGNGDSSATKISGGQVIGRQLRLQDDIDNTFDYQLEPVWKFATGPIGHTLLTGFEYVHQTIATSRSTADLPNILNAFDPVPLETSASNLRFLCDAKHSCDNDNLLANYYSIYATDQMDVTDRLKLRFGVRQDWFDTFLTPLTTVPGRFGTAGQPLLAGVTDSRHDSTFSWNVGVLYKLTPWMSPYFGISDSHLTNFNSENTQNGIGAPESAMQYEAGIKFSFLRNRLIVNTALFDVSRNNVAALTTIAGLEAVVFDSQRTRGGEISVDAQITDQWHVLANFTGQDAVITDNPQGISSIGNRPQGAPAYIANLWTTYDFSIAGVPGFQIGGGLNYQSKSFSDITNVSSIPAYVIFNAAVGYETSRWGIDLNIHNVTNQRYYLAANGAGALVGDPLSAFVNLHMNF